MKSAAPLQWELQKSHAVAQLKRNGWESSHFSLKTHVLLAALLPVSHAELSAGS